MRSDQANTIALKDLVGGIQRADWDPKWTTPGVLYPLGVPASCKG